MILSQRFETTQGLCCGNALYIANKPLITPSVHSTQFELNYDLKFPKFAAIILEILAYALPIQKMKQ